MFQNLKRQNFFNSIINLKYVLVPLYALESIVEKKVQYRQQIDFYKNFIHI